MKQLSQESIAASGYACKSATFAVSKNAAFLKKSIDCSIETSQSCGVSQWVPVACRTQIWNTFSLKNISDIFRFRYSISSKSKWSFERINFKCSSARWRWTRWKIKNYFKNFKYIWHWKRNNHSRNDSMVDKSKNWNNSIFKLLSNK